ncbi:DUF397 domain-containing protein [Streptomyces sp. Tue 6430]|nr:DUF397 domain-containing protein [Streptomyces sp. Tue 6430]
MRSSPGRDEIQFRPHGLARHRPAPHTPSIGQLLDEQQPVAGFREGVAARSHPGGQVIPVRDSKQPQGPRLTLAPTAWTAFLPYASDH